MTSLLRFSLGAVTLSLLATLTWLAGNANVDGSQLARRPTTFPPMGTSPVIVVQDLSQPSPIRWREPTLKSQYPPVEHRNVQLDSVRPSTVELAPSEPARLPVASHRDVYGLEVKPVSGHSSDGRYAPPTPGEIIQASATGQESAVIPRSNDQFDLIVRNRDINYVFNLLNSTGRIKIVALPSVKATTTITLYDTTVEQALDAILKMHGYFARKDGDYTIVYTPEDLELLDPKAGKMEVMTYKPRYISANDLIQVLTPHLTEKGKISSTKANEVGIAANADNAGGDSLAVEDAIVVQDIHAAIERIQKIIDDIDVRPQQVLIEAVLLSVQLDDENRLGVNFALLNNRQTRLAVSGNGATINAAAGFEPSTLISATGKVQGAFASNEHGLKYAVLNGDISAFFSLLETIGQTTVLASPKVLALNKQRASIIVGSQLGYRTVTTTETAAVENVQFLEVGTQLRMRPFVQQNNSIRMELHPEKSSGRVSEATGLPEKDTTQVTTNLTVRSGETIVIGGLIQEQQQRSVQQVPLLGSLPWVGQIFRDETTTINRLEIIVLVTPTIIDEEEEYARSRDEVSRFAGRRDALERSLPFYTRLGLARDHFERACACRDQGDIESALHLVEHAIHFDPTFEAAIKLRRELQAQSAGPASPKEEHRASHEGPELLPARESEVIELAPRP